jgi:nitroreductase
VIVGHGRRMVIPTQGNEAFAHDTAYKNGTLQAAYFLLALRGLGLDTGPMGGFDADKTGAAFFAGTGCLLSHRQWW